MWARQPACFKGARMKLKAIWERIKNCMPKNPYPESVFPMTIDEYVEAVPDTKLRGVISGHLARWQFDVAKSLILEAIKNEFEDIENSNLWV